MYKVIIRRLILRPSGPISLGLWDGDLKDSTDEFIFHPFRLDIARQRKESLECPVGAIRIVIQGLLVRFLETPRATRREYVIGLSHLDVFLAQTGQVQIHPESVRVLKNSRRGRPGGRLQKPPRDAAVDQTHIELVDLALYQGYRIDPLGQRVTRFFYVDLR